MNSFNTQNLTIDSSTEAKVNSILRQRALSLAKISEEEHIDKNTLEVIEFKLSNETYGIETSYVKEVYTCKDIRKIPGVPDYMPGVINMHGNIVSLVDLKVIFGLSPSEQTSSKQNCLFLSSKNSELAILIDSVTGIITLPFIDLAKGFSHDQNTEENYIRTITNENIIILDGARILNDPKLKVNYS